MTKESWKNSGKNPRVLQKKVVIMQLSVFEIITQNSWKQQWIASRYLGLLENGKQNHEKLQVILPNPEGFGEILQYHKRNMDNLFLLDNMVVSTDASS